MSSGGLRTSGMMIMMMMIIVSGFSFDMDLGGGNG